MSQFICVRVSYFVFCVFPVYYCLVVSTSAIDCLGKTRLQMTYHVSSGMLDPICSFTREKSSY